MTARANEVLREVERAIRERGPLTWDELFLDVLARLPDVEATEVDVAARAGGHEGDEPGAHVYRAPAKAEPWQLNLVI